MDRFQAMKVFMGVVEANSFTRAADNLGLPRATVTTTIQGLEGLLKTRLLNRTTRSVSLTPDGAAYYERCARILNDLEETEAAFQDAARRPQGRLRVDVSSPIGRRILIPRLCEFHERYPDVELVIGMGDRPVDLVQEAVDCVIRAGELMDSTLVARRIGTLSFVTCGAPAYLERYGEPKTLEELQHHHAVHYFSSVSGRNFDWDFLVDGVSVPVRMNGRVAVNDSDAYIICGLQGFGLIQPARFMVLPHLEAGELKEILPGWKPPSLPMSVLYPQNRHLSPKVRAFADWAEELFKACPLLSGCDAGGRVGECRYPGRPATYTVREMLQEENVAVGGA
ncbi:LysR family transcriptional regulator [Zoogloea sp.]|uniref:LysR substrate-binding domain-containing protein n=1 Tax=Zoogloea sp. TaxID=49181 RepID=UPI002587DD9D|nr:LysR family transcriptional regulator [Zoogloea sp.]MDD2669148.1 LysR substrate-binding domain-containing protein [Zoogloea sp.]